MKHNKSFLIIVTAIFLLFAGCSSNNDSSKNNGFFSIGSGSDSGGSSSGSGVTLEFAEGNPPSDMFKGQSYNFAFVFKNYQEHEISNLQVKLKGFDTSYVTGLNTDYSGITLPKATAQAGPGLYNGLIVQGVKIDGFVGDYNFNPIFDYGYTAKTTFREAICVPSTLNQCKTDVPKDLKQNGPLKITIDHINSLENFVRIDFSVSNSGKGKVVNEFFDENNNYAADYSLSSATLGSTQGTCEAVSGFQIINGKANFYCEFPRNGDDSYASQVLIELEYKYEETYKKSLIVKDLTQGYN